MPQIRDRLAKMNVRVPLIGDFHYIGHKLLADHPACAEALDKYRINPGNVGFKDKKDKQFGAIVETAIQLRQAGAHRRQLGLARPGTAHPSDGRECASRAAARGARGDARGDGAVGADVRRPRGRDGPAEKPHHPVGQGLGGAGPDRGLSRAGAALRLRDPSRPHRSRHGHRRASSRLRRRSAFCCSRASATPSAYR